MNQAITTPPQSFEERMKARIKESIGDMITDEELAKLVNRGVEEVFFKERPNTKGSYYDNKPLPPLLHQIVNDLLFPSVKAAADKYINDHKEEVKTAINNAIQAGMGAALIAAFSDRFRFDLANFQQSLMNNLGSR